MFSLSLLYYLSFPIITPHSHLPLSVHRPYVYKLLLILGAGSHCLVCFVSFHHYFLPGWARWRPRRLYFSLYDLLCIFSVPQYFFLLV